MKANEKNYQNLTINIAGITLSIMLCAILIKVIGGLLISPIIAKHLAKNQANIKANGCLRYSGNSKHGVSLYSLNGQTSSRIRHITINNSPFQNKWKSYQSDFNMSFDKKYAEKCFSVKYVSAKLFWFTTDFIYDTE